MIHSLMYTLLYPTETQFIFAVVQAIDINPVEVVNHSEQKLTFAGEWVMLPGVKYTYGDTNLLTYDNRTLVI